MIGIAAGLTIGGKIHLQELSLTSLNRKSMTKRQSVAYSDKREKFALHTPD
jgi:hypothetical protein